MDRESRKNYLWVYFVALVIAVAGIVMGDYRTIPEGMKTIFYNNDILITDYVALSGTATAFLNVAMVTFFSAVLMRINHMPMHGKSLFTLGLMAGFAFFGKNIFSMWFILLGSYCLSVVCREKFSKYLISGLLATSLGPIVGVAYLHNGLSPVSIFWSMIIGLIIGFCVPLLAAHTNGILRGLNLYNGGFAVGLLALVVVPVMQGFNYVFENKTSWSTGNNFKFSVFLYLAAIAFIIAGYFTDRENAFKNYKNILKRPGVGKDDFTELDGMGAVLINMGVNTIICTSYVLLVGGALNGPTLGGIFTVIGFSANGKHAKNIIPIMFGIFLGSVISPSVSPQTPGIQMAVFLGTTLAPMAGTYGVIPGIFAGMVHSFAILTIGLGYAGANLYNNGFCGGVVSVVLYPVYSKFFKPNTYSEPSPSRVRLKMTEAKPTSAPKA